MKVEITYKYTEGYLPTKRHRKLRYREVEDVMDVELQTATPSEAPVAFRIDDIFEGLVEYRLWNDQLWRAVNWKDRNADKKLEDGPYPLDLFLQSIRRQNQGWSEEKSVSREMVMETVSESLLIDGVVYRSAGEPRYVVMTFGLGNNHGGTSLSITNWYNDNISKDRYYNALEFEEAVEEARRTAERRGDTEYLAGIGSQKIEVLMPGAVRCNPQTEHGEGDPFLNKLQAMTESTTPNEVKALFVLGAAAEELEREE